MDHTSPKQDLHRATDPDQDIRLELAQVLAEEKPYSMVQPQMPQPEILESDSSFLRPQEYPTYHFPDPNQNIKFAPPPEVITEEKSYSMVQPQMPQPHGDTAYPFQANNDDQPPEQAKEQNPHIKIMHSATETKQQPDQTPKSPSKMRKQRSLRRKESEKDTYFFGILSRKHGRCWNAYRLFIALILLPFTIIGLVFACLIKTVRNIFKEIKEVCCPHSSPGHRSCCHTCQVRANDIDFLVDILICNCKKTIKTCTSCYEGTSECCISCSDGCGSCCTDMGSGCGHCLAGIGHGVCDCFNGGKDCCSTCLEEGKGVFTGCASGIGKCCCLGVELVQKCTTEAGECYSTCCQCQCDWDICDTIQKCCECDINLSGCGDCAGDCCGGGIMDCLECLQGVLCQLIEVLGNICESFGFICECLECIFK